MAHVKNELPSTRERGAVGVEYALLVGLVSLTIIGAVVILGNDFIDWATTLINHVGDLLS